METKSWYSNSDSSYEAKAWRQAQRDAKWDRLHGRAPVASAISTGVSVASVAPKPATPKIYRCRHCGQTGRAGEYPFSTVAGGDICDDCL